MDRKSASVLRAMLGVATLVLAFCGSASAQLRVVSWNTATTASGSYAARQTHFNRVLDYVGREEVNGFARDIDILILQEQRNDGTTLAAFANELNTITGTTDYVAWSETPFNSDGFQVGFVYNQATVQSIFEDWSRTDVARSTGRMALRPVGYGADADVWVYNTHFKAGTSSGDQTRRRDVAIKNRWQTSDGKQGAGNGVDSGQAWGADFLAQDANIIYAGDFNQRSSNEDANNVYPTQLENPYEIYRAGVAPFSSSPPTTGFGQADDPINAPGSWHTNTSFAAIHTQSPHDGSFGLTGGGMDDRFDFQLTSTELNDGEGLSYIGPNAGNSTASEESYRAFGNNGTAFNQAINVSSNTGLDWIITELGETSTERDLVRNSLAAVSDHLPVVMDLQLPAAMDVQIVSSPSRVIQNAAAAVDAVVSNSAAVQVAVGADELDYDLTSSGGLLDSFGGQVDQALGGGNLHQISLDTSVVGSASGSFDVNSSSLAVLNGSFNSGTLNWDVLDHATPSFDSGSEVTTLSLDFGDVAPTDGDQTIGLAVYNLLTTAGFTSAMDLDSISGNGDTSSLTIDLTPFSSLAAGASQAFNADLSVAVDGVLAATYTLSFSDEDIPGEATGVDLTLNLDGYVAIVGDANFDRSVGPADVSVLVSNFGGNGGWTQGNFDGDSEIGPADVSLLVSNFGDTAGPGGGGLDGNVPEPSVMWVFGIGAAVMLMRRRD